MAKYSVDADTMLQAMDDFWSYNDLLHAAENLITAGNSFDSSPNDDGATNKKISAFNSVT